MPVNIPQEITGSNAYIIGLSGASGDETQFNVGIQSEQATIRCRWNRNAETQYNDKIKLMEMMGGNLNLYRFLTNKYDETTGEFDVKFIPPDGETNPGKPDDIRAFVVEHVKTRKYMEWFQNSIVNMVMFHLQAQPIPELPDDVRESWLFYTDKLVDFIENDMWDSSIANDIKVIYKNVLLFRGILVEPPEEGVLTYLYYNVGIIPDFTAIIEFMDRVYRPFLYLFDDVDFYHKQMTWTCAITFRDVKRSFIMRPNARMYIGSEWIVTLVTSQCGEFGNIMYDGLQWTAIVIEAL